MASNNDNFIDISRGFRRLGNFPAFEEEIFETYDQARDYAANGLLGGNAYVGQLLRVIPKNNIDSPKIYVINSDYSLVSTSEIITVEDNLSIHFNFNSFSGSQAISLLLPEGFMLNTLSIKIEEGFKNDNAIRIARCPYDNISNIEYLVASGSGPRMDSAEEQFHPKFFIITDEDDSEFTFKITEVLKKRTLIVVYIDKAIDEDERGSGLLKIN